MSRPAVLRVAPSDDVVRELELLVRARHPLLHVRTTEEERVGVILDHLAERLGVPRFDWTANRGIADLRGGEPIKDTLEALPTLRWVEKVSSEAIFHLRGFGHLLGEPAVAAQLRDLHHALLGRASAVVLTDDDELPPSLTGLVTQFELPPLSTDEYHRLVSAVIRDLRHRANIEIALSPEEVHALLEDLKGLTLFEVQKVITEAVIEDHRLDARDLEAIRAAKMRIVARSGVLEYTPSELTMGDIAGLEGLKAWIRKRAHASHSPKEARKFGLDAPRGLLLLGVQGCGKSLSAKAVASELGLPLLRMDPSSLYNKFFGESEKNLRRAIRLAEAMAPVVLWIDELEKAFASVGDGGNDGGVSHRIFGTFLTWLSDKKETVFVVATANDVSRLPPELVRKGRFDEIFFVDLPTPAVREAILAMHAKKRGHDPTALDLGVLAEASVGFSGAELEQAIVSALYTAFHEKAPLSTELVRAELEATIPLSRTMHEKIDALRAWASTRAVPAD